MVDLDKSILPLRAGGGFHVIKYGEVKYISRSVYVLISQKEVDVKVLFKKLSCYIDESTIDPEKLFVAHVGRTHPLLDFFDTLD